VKVKGIDLLKATFTNGKHQKRSINISEEVDKTAIWKQVNKGNVLFKNGGKTKKLYEWVTVKNVPSLTIFQNFPFRNSMDPNGSDSSYSEKRLSTMQEEEEHNRIIDKTKSTSSVQNISQV
jgi:hypothetical protein